MDWHNTLELNDQVPPTHDKALDALLEKADVYMLSFCGKDRKPQAHYQKCQGPRVPSQEAIITNAVVAVEADSSRDIESRVKRWLKRLR